MSTLYQRLVNENRQMIRKGKREGKKEVAKALIKSKIEDSIILDSTKITLEELENLKKEILVKN